MKRISVVTVTYGSRYEYLSKLIDAVLKNEHVEKLVIVSNGSNDIRKIQSAADTHNGKIIVVALPQNVGSAKAYRFGLESARETQCDFILLLDDDNVPEEHFAQIYLQNLETFTTSGDKEKIILLGNRNKLPGNENFFTNTPLTSHAYATTFFNVFSFQKIKNYLRIVLDKTTLKKNARPFIPIVPAESFAYGGTLLPIQAVKESAFPDERLILYGDDMVYSWNMKNLGYKIYVCSRPYIDDLEISLDAEHHFLAYFLEKTAEFKVFFKIRNSAYLSVAHNSNTVWVIINAILWIIALFAIALVKLPWNKVMFDRMKLILKAIYLGLRKDFTIPKDLKIPASISLQI